MLFDIHKAEWDDELLLLFDIPKAILPHVTDSFGELGVTDHEVCFQTADLIEAMRGDWGASAKTVRDSKARQSLAGQHPNVSAMKILDSHAWFGTQLRLHTN
jgi:hypothetical protein